MKIMSGDNRIFRSVRPSRYQHSPTGYDCMPPHIPRSERPSDCLHGGNVQAAIHRSFRPYEPHVPFHSPAGYAGIRSLPWSCGASDPSRIPRSERPSRYQHSPTGYGCMPSHIPRSERPLDCVYARNIHATIHRSFRPYEPHDRFHSPAGYADIRSLRWSCGISNRFHSTAGYAGIETLRWSFLTI